jgi:hypothetical protein
MYASESHNISWIQLAVRANRNCWGLMRDDDPLFCITINDLSIRQCRGPDIHLVPASVFGVIPPEMYVQLPRIFNLAHWQPVAGAIRATVRAPMIWMRTHLRDARAQEEGPG